MADRRDDPVTPKRNVVANLEMTQAEFVLVVLEAAFDVPATERHVQQDFQWRTRRSIRDKELQ